ncbi:Cytochrome b561 and DOMON domain-containing protein At3g07570 [Linum perenne]
MAFQLNTSSQPSNMLLYSLGPPGQMPAPPTYTLTEHRDKVSTTLNYVTGAIVARYLKLFDPFWFYAHVLIQSMGFLLGMIGVITGLLLADDLDAAHVSTHKALGILVLVLGCLQVMSLMVRPEKSSKHRVYWNYYHFTMGRILMGFAIANVFYGIHLGGEGSGWNGGYGTVLAVLFVIVIILELRMRLKN